MGFWPFCYGCRSQFGMRPSRILSSAEPTMTFLIRLLIGNHSYKTVVTSHHLLICHALDLSFSVFFLNSACVNSKF